MDKDEKNIKLYGVFSLVVSTILAGWFGGGFLLYLNFRRLEERNMATNTLLFLVLSMAITANWMLFIDSESLTIPYFFALGGLIFVFRYQAKSLQLHQASGGKMENIFKAALVSVGITVGLLFVIVFILSFVAPDLLQNIASKYGNMTF